MLPPADDPLCNFTGHISVLKNAHHSLMCREVVGLPFAPAGRAGTVVAVQDMSSRLPHTGSASSLDAIASIPLDRWDVDSMPESSVGGRFGGFVDAWADFDAPAFGITPSEAALMDPQQRALLEVSAGLQP